MNILFEASFAKDLKRIRDKQLLQRVDYVIEEVKAATDLSQVRNLGKIQGYDSLYRIRLGDYRIGIEVIAGEVIFARFLHRKDIYRNFP